MATTTLLSKAIDKAKILPAQIQDKIAVDWLEDIENELKWQNELSNSQDKIDVLVQDALRESDEGKTFKKGFDEI